jgi:rhodanese-related sulfurtransferase
VNTISTICYSSHRKNHCISSTLLTTLIILITQFSGCTSSTTSITGAELANQITTNKAPIILDTRSHMEFESGHVPGALYFPFWKAFFADDTLLQRCKTEPVVVYCQHGPRASFAGFALRQSGCSKVIELEGHMVDWKEQGLPVVAVSNENNKTKAADDN